MHFEQAHRHHADIGLHPSPVRPARRLDHGVHARLFVGNQAHPGHVQVREGPCVLEGRASRLRPDGGLVGAVGVERRVQVDQVHAGGVHAAQDVEVVLRPQRLVGEVGLALSSHRCRTNIRASPPTSTSTVCHPAASHPCRACAWLGSFAHQGRYARAELHSVKPRTSSTPANVARHSPSRRSARNRRKGSYLLTAAMLAIRRRSSVPRAASCRCSHG